MKLFAFGLGYSALHFINRYGDLFSEVVGTVRSAEKAEALAQTAARLLTFNTDIQDPAIGDHLKTSDAVLVSIPPGTSADPVLSHYGRMLSGLRRPLRIIYLSTIGVYGDRQGEWVDEDRLPVPASPRSTARLQAEKAWSAIGKDADKTVHILRLAGIYGPARNALANLKAGKAKRIVKKDQVFNRIHVEDIAISIANALMFDGKSQIWNVSDDEPAPPQDVVTYAAELMGIAPPPEQDIEDADLTPMARSFYAENKRASNRKLKQDLGMSLAFPTYREGLKALWDAGEGRD
jgi:nucleoside-diphosphate-sugar epimerase